MFYFFFIFQLDTVYHMQSKASFCKGEGEKKKICGKTKQFPFDENVF